MTRIHNHGQDDPLEFDPDPVDVQRARDALTLRRWKQKVEARRRGRYERELWRRMEQGETAA